jgi:hypothetical protein
MDDVLQELISPTYYVQLLRRYFCAKNVLTLKLSYKKAARKMLVNLTSGLNFTNVLCAAFAPTVLRQ